LFALAFLGVASAQTEWRRVGASAMESNLAGPITGPMTRVWYSADGSVLYAQTSSAAKVFQTEDFENWTAAVNPPAPPAAIVREPVRKPEPSAVYVALHPDSQEMWALGQQLYRSADGKTWETLTSYRTSSVIGPGLTSIAASPSDPNQLAVANSDGVWRTMDGGLTWASLNLMLPNLSVRRILATPSGGHPALIQTENLGLLDLAPGSQVWRQHLAAVPDPTAGHVMPGDISASAASADSRHLYVGSVDGRIWRSDDGGSFTEISAGPAAPGRKVERLYVDPQNPMVVLAAMGGDGPHVLRTATGGSFWDPLDSPSLPSVTANSVTADPSSGAVYVATDKGVYWTHFAFDTAGRTDNLTWTGISENLPTTKAVDVALDPAGVQLYAAIEGYGMYGAPAPHRGLGVRLVNTADYSNRPASPGSLVSVVGEKVNSVSSGTVQYPLWNQSQIQVPFEAVGPTVSLALETAGGTTMRDLQVLPVSPAIFVVDGVPVILDADSGLPLEGNVAHSGQRLQIMLNGLGKVQPDWPTGVAAPAVNTPVVKAKVQAFVDGNEVTVAQATLAPGYVGMYLVEVQLPSIGNSGGMELHVTADGQESNRVPIVIVQ
jgi:uncharacterized protein (TIGR03437 family)